MKSSYRAITGHERAESHIYHTSKGERAQKRRRGALARLLVWLDANPQKKDEVVELTALRVKKVAELHVLKTRLNIVD